MMKFTQSFALAGCFALFSAAQTHAQRDFSDVEITVSTVADGVYMLRGAGGNMGLSVGDDGSFLIDDQFAPLSDRIIAAIKTVSDDPVEFVLNTHWHGDHTGGNEAFGEAGAHVLAHENVRKRLKAGLTRTGGAVTPPAQPGALPTITFSKDISFYWNDHDIHIWHPDPAHTDGDAIVMLRGANVVHMGDIFFNGTYPFIDIESGGDLDGYIAAVEMVLAKINDETKIIPGHGPLAGKADLENSLAMLQHVRARVQALIDESASADEAVAADPLKDLNPIWGQGFINGERMVRAAHASLSK
ncbi:MAG: MBL fold metallo-hydrolase [Pseudomonadota bacterium]